MSGIIELAKLAANFKVPLERIADLMSKRGDRPEVVLSERSDLLSDIAIRGPPLLKRAVINLAPVPEEVERLTRETKVAATWVMLYYYARTSWRTHLASCDSCRKFAPFPEFFLKGKLDMREMDSIELPRQTPDWHRTLAKLNLAREDCRPSESPAIVATTAATVPETPMEVDSAPIDQRDTAPMDTEVSGSSNTVTCVAELIELDPAEDMAQSMQPASCTSAAERNVTVIEDDDHSQHEKEREVAKDSEMPHEVATAAAVDPEREEQQGEEPEDAAECPLCLSLIAEPLVLQCLPKPHMLCRVCVQSLVDAQLLILAKSSAPSPATLRIRCPKCSQPTTVSTSGAASYGLKSGGLGTSEEQKRIRQWAGDFASQWETLCDEVSGCESLCRIDEGIAAVARQGNEVRNNVELELMHVEAEVIEALHNRRRELTEKARQALDGVMEEIEGRLKEAREDRARIAALISQAKALGNIGTVEEAKVVSAKIGSMQEQLRLRQPTIAQQRQQTTQVAGTPPQRIAISRREVAALKETLHRLIQSLGYFSTQTADSITF